MGEIQNPRDFSSISDIEKYFASDKVSKENLELGIKGATAFLDTGFSPLSATEADAESLDRLWRSIKNTTWTSSGFQQQAEQLEQLANKIARLEAEISNRKSFVSCQNTSLSAKKLGWFKMMIARKTVPLLAQPTSYKKKQQKNFQLLEKLQRVRKRKENYSHQTGLKKIIINSYLNDKLKGITHIPHLGSYAPPQGQLSF